MSKYSNSPYETVQALIAGKEDLVSRIAAPLWSRVGRPLLSSDLTWARSLLGEEGHEILLQALSSTGAVAAGTGVLTAQGLSRFLALLLGDRQEHISVESRSPQLVWTLPKSHPAQSVRGHSYLEACTRLVNQTRTALAIVSPFIDQAGIGTLRFPLLSALSRGVTVKLFVHDALNLSTQTSRSLEGLRREASRTNGDLSVFSAEAGTGSNRAVNPLLHAKLVICDGRCLLLGSANLTSYAFGSNFEAGVVLGKSAAKEALYVLDGILQAKAVYLAFRIKGGE